LMERLNLRINEAGRWLLLIVGFGGFYDGVHGAFRLPRL
jgi:hypothetical protein